MDGSADSFQRADALLRRRRRRRRRLVALITFLVFAVAIAVVTRPTVLRWMLEPALARAFGGDVVLDDVSMDTFSTLHVGRMSLIAPGWRGEAGEVVLAENVVVRVALGHLLTGSLHIEAMDFGLLRIRAAERESEPGRFNLIALKPDTAAGDEPMRLARVDIERLEIEMGTVDRAGVFHLEGRRVLTGEMKPDPRRGDGTLLTFALKYLDEAPGESSRLLSGRWDERTFAFDMHVGAINLDRALAMAPLSVRESMEALGLAGTVRSAKLAWSPDDSLSADIDVEDVSLTLRGFDLGERWVRVEGGKRVPSHGLPTLRLKEGTIRFRSDQLILDGLKGELASSVDDPKLVPLPADVTFKVGLDPDMLRTVEWSDAKARDAWLREFLATAPFELKLTIRGFQSGGAAPGAAAPDAVLEMPAPIAAVLETFSVTAWKLDVEAAFSRAAPIRDADGKLTARVVKGRGQALLADGRGAYADFAYPLEHVQAHLNFDQTESGDDRVTIDYLSATGPRGGAIAIHGTVEHPGSQSAVHLTLSAAHTPLDDTLFGCFHHEARAALESLFHAPSSKAMTTAGLLNTNDSAELAATARALEAKLATADPELKSALTTELARTQRMIEARPFVLGGDADVDLLITREGGVHMPTIGVGTMVIHRAGVIVDEFPYPLTVTGGSLAIDREGITVRDDGLRAITQGGGAVRVTGRVNFRQDVSPVRVEPAIQLVCAGDRVTPLLLAAIPPESGDTVEGWPGAALSPAGNLLRAAHLTGDIDFRVVVGAAPASNADSAEHPIGQTRLDVQLSQGTIDIERDEATPDELPAPLALRDVLAVLHIEGGQVQVVQCAGTTTDGTGKITVTGTAGPHENRDLSFTLDNARVEAWMVEMLRGPARATALALWNETTPTGKVDGTLHMRCDASGERVVGEMTPQFLSFTLDGQQIDATRTSGSITIDARDGATMVTASNLVFGVGHEGMDGSWSIDGTASVGTDNDSLRATIATELGHWESPLVAAVMRRAAGSEVADPLLASRPEGVFSARATLSSDGGGPLHIELRLDPSTLTCTIADARPEITFSGGGYVRASNEEIEIHQLIGHVDGGTITADGSVDLADVPHELAGTLGIEAEHWTPAITAFLPEPLNTARRALGFTADSLSMPGSIMHVVWDPDRGIAAPIFYALTADATASGAAFTIGVPFTDVEGATSIDFSYREPPDGRTDDMHGAALRAHLKSSTARVYDRVVTDGNADIELERHGKVLSVQRFDGTLAGGRIAGEADLALADMHYVVDVRLSGAGVGPLLDPTDTKNGNGLVDGRLAIEGDVDNTNSRRGRGRIVIRDATMASSPLTLRLLEISQLALPLSSALRAANISFYIDGPLARFERFHLESGSVDIDGRGYVDTRDFTIAAAFKSRGRLAIIRELVGAVTDTLWEIEVTGPLKDPKASMRPLPGLGAADADRAPPVK